jgi:hypothetical protein
MRTKFFMSTSTTAARALWTSSHSFGAIAREMEQSVIDCVAGTDNQAIGVIGVAL